MENSNGKIFYVYYCGSEACEPGHSFGPAVRPHYLIHFILDGRGSYTAGGETYALKAGDAFLIRPGVSTFYQADLDEPWAYTWAAFDGAEAEELLGQCGFDQDNPVYVQEANAQLRDLCGQLAGRFASADYSQLELRGLLYLIFSRMLKAEPPVRSELQWEYVKKACDYIEHNFRYDIRVADIARYVGIDRTYLYKVFIAVKGLSPLQYLLEKRLNEARNLLLLTPLKVTEIAYSCGFHDAPSFCRHFKLSEGSTPLQYRKKVKYF